VTKQVVIYARNSTRQQEQAETIETQLDFIRNDKLTVERWGQAETLYLDRGVSGYRKPLWERPGGKRLLLDAKAGLIDTVIVYRFDRLGRKLVDVLQAIEELANAEATIWDSKQGRVIDSKTPEARLLLNMMASFGEFERDLTAGRTWDGLNRKYKAGGLLPNYAQYGYKWSELTPEGRKVKGAKLVIDAEEANTVRRIYRLAETTSVTGIAKILNAEGVRFSCKSPGRQQMHQRTSRLWEYRDITKIITDPIYNGVIEWGRTVAGSERFPISYSHDVPELQIIPSEEWHRAQRLHTQRMEQPAKSAASEHIYSGKLRCWRCGGRTVFQAGFYICRAYHEHGKVGCEGFHIKEETVTAAVIPFIADLLESKLGIRNYLRQEAYKMTQEEDVQVQRLTGRKQKAEVQLANTQQLAIDGLLSPTEARPKIEEYRETIASVERDLATISRGSAIRKELADAVAAISEDLKGSLERLKPPILQQVIRQIFEKFSVKTEGRSTAVRGWVASYEFKTELQALLATGFHIEATCGHITRSYSSQLGCSPPPQAR
jgi:site-specific DNA recombinase